MFLDLMVKGPMRAFLTRFNADNCLGRNTQSSLASLLWFAMVHVESRWLLLVVDALMFSEGKISFERNHLCAFREGEQQRGLHALIVYFSLVSR